MVETISISRLLAWRALLVSVTICSVLVPLNSTMISVALPDIMREFQVEVGVAGWLVIAYLVTMVVFQLIAGRLGDQWGRRGVVLGDNYFVSTGFGGQLFANQKLVIGDPYAIVRHPMNAGLLLSSLGSLLIYHTWTALLFTFFASALFIRARREEAAMAVEFGEADYAR